MLYSLNYKAAPVDKRATRKSIPLGDNVVRMVLPTSVRFYLTSSDYKMIVRFNLS